MINFRWGQAGGQASGFNLADAQAILRGLRKGKGRLGQGGREGGGGGVETRSVGLALHALRTPHPHALLTPHPHQTWSNRAVERQWRPVIR